MEENQQSRAQEEKNNRLRGMLEKHYLGGLKRGLGAETGHRKGKIRPEKEWITSIIENARTEGIALFIKENAGWEERIQEYPLLV